MHWPGQLDYSSSIFKLCIGSLKFKLEILQVINIYTFYLKINKFILSNDVNNKNPWNLFMIFCVQVNAFILCLISVDATVRKDEYRRDEGWGGGEGDKWNSWSYWKADVSTLVNISVFSPQTGFTAGITFLFHELPSLHTSNNMLYGRNVKPDLSHMDPIHLLFNACSPLCVFSFPLKPNSHFFFQTGLLNGKELRATILKGKIYNINTHWPLEYLGRDI